MHAGLEDGQNALVAVFAGRVDAGRMDCSVVGRGDPGMIVVFGIVRWNTWRSKRWHNLWNFEGMAVKSCR
jgi:hypothetical protein